MSNFYDGLINVHSSAWNKVQFRVHCLRHYVTAGYIDGYIGTDLQKIHLAPATQDKIFVHILKPVNVFTTEKSENSLVLAVVLGQIEACFGGNRCFLLPFV